MPHYTALTSALTNGYQRHEAMDENMVLYIHDSVCFDHRIIHRGEIMEIKVCVKTPKGQALAASKRLRPFIAKSKEFHKVYVNADDDELYWEIKPGNYRRYQQIVKNVARYDTVVKSIFSNKVVRKLAMKDYTPEQWEEVSRLIEDGTRVEILKMASAQEIVEGNRTFWQRIKDTFRQSEP